MFKFIHVTDTHFVEPGGTLYGLDPQARFAACVADINAHHADAAFCVVTGDLAHFGAPAAYELFAETVGQLQIPVHLMIGNHDDRDAFRTVFPQAPVDGAGFVQHTVDTPVGRCVLLDTHDPDGAWGSLCEARLAWLGERLAEVPDRPVLLFLHHPPFTVGVHNMDRISLRAPDRLLAVLAPHKARIRHLFFGHLHRPLCGSWHGIPMSTLPATNHQVALDFDVTDGVPGSHEPPAYGVVLVDAARVIVHTHGFLDRSKRFML